MRLLSCVLLCALLPVAVAAGAFPQKAASKPAPGIFMIGHAHIDPVWRWTKEEGQAEVLATFRSALKRMREYPDVAFVSSSAQFYRWALESDPAMFAEIKERVKEGRWNVVGGWWVEPDLNCPLGESLVRQGLYGQLFFEKNLGTKARIGFNPDSFGHPWTLPQILAGQGLEAYVYMRPSPTEKPDVKTPLFGWRGPDGTKIPAIQILGSYNGTEGDLEDRINLYGQSFGRALPGVKDWAVFYGIGDHGGGPTIAAIEKIKALQKGPFPGIRFATLDQYAEAVLPGAASWPVVSDELQHHARGCYSVTAGIKQWNRRAEWALLTAEKAASIAAAFQGGRYPAERLRRAWEKVLFNQFHDILAGSAIEQAYADARDDFGFAVSEAREIGFDALQGLAQALDTETGTTASCAPFVVFNPNSWAAAVPIETEMERLGEGRPRLFRVGGAELPYQEVRTAGVKVGSRIRFAFRDELPALGCALYAMDFGPRSVGAEPAAPAGKGVAAGPWTLENESVRLTFDPDSGAIASYFDKTEGRELLRALGAFPIVLQDTDDTWGHRVTSYDHEIGRFGKPEFRLVERGPERGRVEVRSKFGSSSIIQDFELYRGLAEVRVKVSVDWHEYYNVLKLGFPTVLAKGESTYSAPYGFIIRPMMGEEEPVQTWLDVSGEDSRGKFGFALLNDSKCGVDVKDGEIRLTVLHSTAWSHHNPEKITADEGYRLIDTGIHEFSYALVPHTGGWREAGIARQAEEFGLAPLLVLTDRHKSRGPGAAPAISVSSPDVSISSLKMAERENALVLRLVELHGRAAQGTIAGFGNPIAFRLRPNEIKTFLIPLDKSKPPREVNLLEE